MQDLIKFKTTSVIKNLLVGTLFSIALIGIILLISGRFRVNAYLISIILLAIGIVISFFVSYVSNDETTLSSDDINLYFSTKTSLIYSIKDKVLQKQEIKCFQITPSKLYDYLVFYFFDKKPCVIVLGRNETTFTTEIEELLKSEGIRSLKDSKLISDFSFSEVFKRSFFDHLFFGTTLILIQFSIILLYKHILHEIYQVTPLSIVISTILIWSLYNKYFKRKWSTNIRWNSIFGACYIMTFFSLILIGLCSKPIDTVTSKPIHIKNITEAQKNKAERFFVVDQFGFKKNKVGFYQSHSKNSKSGTHTIKNVFSIPFKTQDIKRKRYSYWTSLSFEHSFKNASQDYLIELKRSDFEKFKNTMDNPIGFFELVHYAPEGILKDKLSLESVESTWQYMLPLYIFKPQSESFEDYKQKKTEFLFFFLIGLVFVSALNGFIYAKSR